jgi:hypothetical protein
VDHPGVKVWLDGYMAIVAEIDAGGSAGGNACYPRNWQVVAPLWLHVRLVAFYAIMRPVHREGAGKCQ